MKKILLLDIENLPKTENELLKFLSQYQHVFLVYAKAPTGFSLDSVVKLSPYIASGKLKILKMPKIGKNAADFGLAFVAGQLSIQFKANEVCFCVMSNDHSMEYVVDLLKIAKFHAEVISNKPLLQQNVAQKLKQEVNITAYMVEYCFKITTTKFSKPARVETLLNSLKSNFKIENELCRLIVDELKNLKLIKIEQTKVQYQMNAIQKYVSTNQRAVLVAEKQVNDIDSKLSDIRLKLMPYLNVALEKRPKYLASFESLLEKILSKDQAKEAFQLLLKYELISLNKREIIYSSQLLAN